MGYRDPEFEVLPAGWSISELQELVENHNPKRQPLNSQERVTRQGVHPYCGANGVVDHINDFKFDGDFVLIAEDGGYWGKHEPSSYIMRGRFWVNNHAHVVRAKDGVTTNEYLSFMLNYLNIDPFIGGDARGKLTKAVLQQIEVPHPDFPEQQRIAQVLSTVQEAIAQQERLIRTTTELKQALMQKLFTEGLRGEALKETEIGRVPESWEVVELGKYCTVQSGFAFSSDSYVAPEFGIPITKIGDIQDGRVLYNENSSYVPTSYWDNPRLDSFKLKPGDVLMALTGATTGKSGIFEYARKAFLNQRAGRLTPNENCLRRTFLKHVVRQTYFQSEVASNILVAAQGNISPKAVERIKVAVPATEEQDDIAVILQALERKANGAENRRNKLQDLFRTLLHELMTGKVRVGQAMLT